MQRVKKPELQHTLPWRGSYFSQPPTHAVMLEQQRRNPGVKYSLNSPVLARRRLPYRCTFAGNICLQKKNLLGLVLTLTRGNAGLCISEI